jgi:hypothetical protein
MVKRILLITFSSLMYVERGDEFQCRFLVLLKEGDYSRYQHKTWISVGEIKTYIGIIPLMHCL